MSKKLEELEMAAKAEQIKDAATIDRIVSKLLETPLSELGGAPTVVDYLTKDIAQGYVLESEKVKDCSLSEILMLIGFEPGVPWFEFPEEDTWFWNDEHGPAKSLFAANHCFVLGSILDYATRSNLTVKQFMRINYWSFMRFLSDRVAKFVANFAAKYNYSPTVVRKISMKNNVITKNTVKLVAAGKPELADITDFSELNALITVGDVISTLIKLGTKGWSFGVMPFSDYFNRTISVYRAMKNFFMDCIKDVLLIGVDNNYLHSVLDRCSSTGTYDSEYFDEICFEDCFETNELIVKDYIIK